MISNLSRSVAKHGFNSSMGCIVLSSVKVNVC